MGHRLERCDTSLIPEIPILDRDGWLNRLDQRQPGPDRPYYAFYASTTGGITTDPALMQVPVDDHLVHRGDGIFETLKSVNGAVYNAEAHLDRLAVSALGIGLGPCPAAATLQRLMVAALRAAGQPDAAIRILLSRGSGSMGVNPYDCIRPEIYILVGPLGVPLMQRQPDGARIGYSRIPPKPPPFAAIKHCNYLPNALMAKEACDRGFDFVISRGADGRVLEGPTENLAVVTEDGWLLAPDTPDILPGTTLERVMTLAEPLREAGVLTGIRHARMDGDMLSKAREVLITGTTHDLVAVVAIENQAVGDGQPGPIYHQLSQDLREDIRSGPLRLPWMKG